MRTILLRTLPVLVTLSAAVFLMGANDPGCVPVSAGGGTGGGDTSGIFGTGGDGAGITCPEGQVPQRVCAGAMASSGSGAGGGAPGAPPAGSGSASPPSGPSCHGTSCPPPPPGAPPPMHPPCDGGPGAAGGGPGALPPEPPGCKMVCVPDTSNGSAPALP